MNQMFGVRHIICMVVSFILVIVLSVLTRKMKIEKMTKILLYIGIVSEIIKIFSYSYMNQDRLGGYLPRSDLPFHLCSIQIIFILILNISKNEKLNRSLMSFMIPSCLIGAFAAIVLATDSSRNRWLITIQYFIYHSALMVYAIKLLTSKEFNLTFKDFISCMKVLLVMLFVAIYTNSMMYNQDDKNLVNFMYIINPPMEGLPYLNKNQGWLMYAMKYASIVVLACALVYIVPIINAVKGLFKKKTETTETTVSAE